MVKIIVNKSYVLSGIQVPKPAHEVQERQSSTQHQAIAKQPERHGQSGSTFSQHQRGSCRCCSGLARLSNARRRRRSRDGRSSHASVRRILCSATPTSSPSNGRTVKVVAKFHGRRRKSAISKFCFGFLWCRSTISSCCCTN